MGSDRPYDMEERTFLFARDVRAFVRRLPRVPGNLEDGSQLIRSSGSVGANFIEARESLGKKDALMRLRIARKEAKESRYWLRLMAVDDSTTGERDVLVQEATELLSILSTMIQKTEG